MNKYLIVVFCVLTGCAVVVPYEECEALNLDTQLLAEWYADHGITAEENYSIQYIIRQEVPAEQEQVISASNSYSDLLQNLPSLPDFTADGSVEWPPVHSQALTLSSGVDGSYFPLAISEGLHIRAPDYRL